MVDATIVPVPKQRNSGEENETVKRGETPAAWEEKPAKNRQKDKDAHWTKKHGKSFFGYKNHVNADKTHKLIRDYEVTDAAVHDSRYWRRCSTTPTPPKTCSATAPIGRPRPRRSWPREAFAAASASRHAWPSAVEGQGDGNRAKSRIRARIEHVFGTQETAPGGRILRTIGISRSACKTLSTTSADWRRSNGWPPPDGWTPSAASENKR